MNTKKTRYSHYNLNYHLVWIPKYRRKILTGDIAQRLSELLRETADKNDIQILSESIQPDHVHLFVSAPPRLSPANIVNIFKGFSGRLLRQEFPSLLMKHHKERVWTRTYYVGTAGSVSAETILNYIQEQEGGE
jgi:putative transposase